jgi:aminoglycoside phosphotransferase (APT) family kinase protein
MGFVDGRVPSDDRPSFAEAGFLFDATAAQQRVFHTGLLDALAAIHATPLTPALSSALRPAAEVAAPVAAVEALERTWAFDQGPSRAAIIEVGFAALRASWPVGGDDLLLWGDARPANVIVAPDGFTPVALLDWELAAIGPAELDLMWLAEMNRMRMEGSGVAPLPGLLPDDEAIAHYEQRGGRRLVELGWYRRYSALRIAVLMHRHLRVMVHLGRLPADHPVFRDNVATRRLAELLDA